MAGRIINVALLYAHLAALKAAQPLVQAGQCVGFATHFLTRLMSYGRSLTLTQPRTNALRL
jgi:hypothetical protein